MLSATLTDASLETLRSLFGAESNFESLAAVQLRLKDVSDDDWKRAIDALRPVSQAAWTSISI